MPSSAEADDGGFSPRPRPTRSLCHLPTTVGAFGHDRLFVPHRLPLDVKRNEIFDFELKPVFPDRSMPITDPSFTALLQVTALAVSFHSVTGTRFTAEQVLPLGKLAALYPPTVPLA